MRQFPYNSFIGNLKGNTHKMSIAHIILALIYLSGLILIPIGMLTGTSWKELTYMDFIFFFVTWMIWPFILAVVIGAGVMWCILYACVWVYRKIADMAIGVLDFIVGLSDDDDDGDW